MQRALTSAGLDASRRALHRLGIIGASSILLSPSAGLLTFPDLLYLPDFCQWRYTSKPFKGGLQLQVQFQTLTGLPYIRRHRPPDCHFGCKDSAKFRFGEEKTNFYLTFSVMKSFLSK
jgi:hypothetical protein